MPDTRTLKIVHSLLRQPLFTLAVVTTLALAVASNGIVFGIYDSVIRQALPFEEPDRLVMLWVDDLEQEKLGERTSFQNFEDVWDQAESLSGLAAMTRSRVTLTGERGADQIDGAPVSSNFFELLGVKPLLGRALSPGRGEQEGTAVILGHRIWQERYGGDPEIVGRDVEFGGEPRTVFGVMPPGFRFPDWAEYWVPLATHPAIQAPRSLRWLELVGRLEEGVDLRQVRAEMDTVGHRLAQQYPEANAGTTLRVEPLAEEIVGETRLFVFLLFGASALLVVIACANVANLLMVRALTRQRELAVRACLGASRRQLGGRLVAEVVILGTAGATGGLLLAWGGLKVLARFHPSNLSRLAALEVSWSLVLFTVATAFAAALIAALLPLVRLLRGDLAAPLHEGSRSATEAFRIRRLRGALVAAQIALTVILLVGTGFLGTHLYRSLRVDAGFATNHLLTLKISLPRSSYPEQADKARFFPAVLERIEALPRVRSASATSGLLSEAPVLFPFRSEERRGSGEERQGMVGSEAVTPEYFKTLGVPLRAGRVFTPADHDEAPRVAVINEKMAHLFWPDENPVGEKLVFWDPIYGEEVPETALTWREVVGVVGDTRRYDYRDEPIPEIYVPFAQSVRRGMRLIVRTDGVEPEELTGAVRAAVREHDPNLPIQEVKSMEELLADPLSRSRVNTVLSTLFAVAGIVLATIGLYGVMAFSVARSRREVGVRSALGADRGRLFRMVVGQGFMLLIPGMVLGLAGGWMVGRLVADGLFGVSPAEPVVFLAATAVVVAVAVPAVCLPAWRAVSTDPGIVLQSE